MRSPSRLMACLIVVLFVVAVLHSSVAYAGEPLPATITLDDLPDGFVADGEAEIAEQSLGSDTVVGFGFTDPDNATMLVGLTEQADPDELEYITGLLQDTDMYLDLFMEDTDLIPEPLGGSVIKHRTVGDASVVLSVDNVHNDASDDYIAEFGEEERIDHILFTSGDMVALVWLSYPTSNPPEFTVEYIGALLAERMDAAATESAPEKEAAVPEATVDADAPTEYPLLRLTDLPNSYQVADDDDIDGMLGDFGIRELAEPLGTTAYGSELEQEVIVGILFDLQDPMLRLYSGVVTSDPSTLLAAMTASGEFDAEMTGMTVDSTVEAGESSAAFSMVIPADEEFGFLLDMQFEMLWFEQDPYLGMLMLIYPSDESPEYELGELASIWEAEIQAAIESDDAVAEEPKASVPESDATIKVAALNVRTGPGTDYSRIGSLKSGDGVEVTGRNDDCTWIEVETPDEVVGWISASATYVDLQIDCDSAPVVHVDPVVKAPESDVSPTADAPDSDASPSAVAPESNVTPAAQAPVSDIRPNTGVLVNNIGSPGWGELIVDNGSNLDHMVLLTDLNDNVIGAAYVRMDDTYTFAGVPDGDYLVYFVSGSNWNEQEKMFDEVSSYSQFEDSLDFYTDNNQAVTWSITLHTVAGGNAETSRVNANDFPTID